MIYMSSDLTPEVQNCLRY